MSAVGSTAQKPTLDTILSRITLNMTSSLHLQEVLAATTQGKVGHRQVVVARTNSQSGISAEPAKPTTPIQEARKRDNRVAGTLAGACICTP